MNNIINDIIENVEIKPKASKLIIKWIYGIAVFAIGVAFTYGQIRTARLYRFKEIENKLDNNTQSIIELKNEVVKNFYLVDEKINRIYDDGLKLFKEYEDYNNKKLQLIIDYNKTDKEMLKKMLDILSMQEQNEIKNFTEEHKNNSNVIPTTKKYDSISIKIIPLNKNE